MKTHPKILAVSGLWLISIQSAQSAVMSTTYADEELYVSGLQYAGIYLDDPLRLRPPIGPGSHRIVDLDQNGTTDFVFRASSGGVILQMWGTNRITGYGSLPGNSSLAMNATEVFPGEILGSSLPDGVKWHYNLYGAQITRNLGGLLPGEHVFGLEFSGDDGIHYGYARTFGNRPWLYIRELAWETEPGKPIQVPIPEPGAAALMAISLLAATRRRKKRNASQPESPAGIPDGPQKLPVRA